MVKRFSILSNQTYSNYVTALHNSNNNIALDTIYNSFNQIGLSNNPMLNAISLGDSKLVTQIALSTKDATNSINGVNSSIKKASSISAISNIFGALITSGTILISTKYILDRMNQVSGDITNTISIGVDKLGSIFTEGLSLVSSKLDIQSNQLDNLKEQLEKINETLKSPVMTKAVEQRNIGLERISHDLIPEAIESFKNAVAFDATDPISNLMLGKLYLDGVDGNKSFYSPETAIEFFNKAIRYSDAFSKKAPEFKNIKIEALYLSSITILSIKDSEKHSNLEEGLEIINKLLEIYPDHNQAMYLKAKILVALKRKEEALKIFEILFSKDSTYLGVALEDDDFSKNSEVGVILLDHMIDCYVFELRKKFNKLYETIDFIYSWDFKLPNELLDWLQKYNLINSNNIDFILKQKNDITNPKNNILSILTISIIELESIANSIVEEYSELFKNKKYSLYKLIDKVKFEFIDENWLSNLPKEIFLNKLKLTNYFRQSINPEFDNISVFNLSLENLNQIYNEIKSIENKSNTCNDLIIKYKDTKNSILFSDAYLKEGKINFSGGDNCLGCLIYPLIFSICIYLSVNIIKNGDRDLPLVVGIFSGLIFAPIVVLIFYYARRQFIISSKFSYEVSNLNLLTINFVKRLEDLGCSNIFIDKLLNF